MQDWLSAQAAAQPDRPALIADERVWTYAELESLAGCWAAFLSAQGLAAGRVVAALLPNRVEYVFLIHALARLGITLSPLNTRLTPHELGDQLRQVNAALLIACEETETAARRAAEPMGTRVLLAEAVAHQAERLPPTPPQELALTATQAILFTSGTSGRPKGARLSFGNHFWSATASAFRLGILPSDRWLCPLPLYHVGGLAIVLRSCLYGTAAILQEGFEPGRTLELIERHRASLVSLVPTMLHRMLGAHPEHSLPESIRLALLGGAATSPELMQTAEQRNLPAAVSYGLTEACSQVATLLAPASYRKPGSVGRPLVFTEVQIRDVEDRPAPPGVYGEIVVRGPTVMQGYHNDPQATVQALRAGWLHTGDIGYLDDEGDLWLVQRRSDLIVSGGENIYPAEVEAALKAHPAVAEACVVGLPSAEWGQQVAAAVVLRPDLSVTPDELLAFTRQRLAGYKQPRRLRLVASLPQTASGKIHRAAVVDLLAQSDHAD